MAAESHIAPWLDTLDILQSDEYQLGSVATPRPESSPTVTGEPLAEHALSVHSTGGSAGTDDSGDDLAVDLAIAALDTGRIAFDAREWDEAEALFHEAVQILRQLPKQQRLFCDVFALHYRLAVCAFHTQEPAVAEQVLMSLNQQRISSKNSEHQIYRYDAAHLLSVIYVRTGQIDFARVECERALQGRRQQLGKHSQASLESTALVAHIYALLDNRARAKAYLAMIPESRRDDVDKVVEACLGTALERPDSSLQLLRTNSDPSTLVTEPAPSASSDSGSVFSPHMANRCSGPVSVRMLKDQAGNLRSSCRYSLSKASGLESLDSSMKRSGPSMDDRRQSRHIGVEKRMSICQTCTKKETNSNSLIGTKIDRIVSNNNAISTSTTLSRKAILRNLRCTPVDRLEEAVCSGDRAEFEVLLKKRQHGGFLQSKVRKVLHSRRVTALHFAALFGEVEMVCRLISAGFDVNEVPEFSTSRLTPLKFAVGARQVDTVKLLIANGAKPVEPDTWSTLIGEIMNRSWIVSTMSIRERENLSEAPDNMLEIMRIWLKHGWDVNTVCEANSGRTALHQAIAFESGFYRWDSNLRATMTEFLCEQGADPLKCDAKGNTPYDMVSVVKDQDLLLILDRSLEDKRINRKDCGLAELSARRLSPIELFDRSTTVPPKPANVTSGRNVPIP